MQARDIFELLLNGEEVAIRYDGKLRFAVLMEDLRAKSKHVMRIQKGGWERQPPFA
jgi:hypothetical protein